MKYRYAFLLGRPGCGKSALYLHDDQDAFVQYMKDRSIPVLVVNNEADGEEYLKKQVEELFKTLSHSQAQGK